MYDTHMHTSPFSTDSPMLIEEVLKKQKELSIGIVLTEHMDFGFPPPDEYHFHPVDYFEAYQPYRNDTFLLGTEIGMQTHVLNQNIDFVRSHPFDMVIASIHAVNGYDLYYQDYFQSMGNKKQAYRTYFQTMLENIQLFDDFDTLGHIDYICRKAPYKDSELYYSDFPDEIDLILKTILQKEKVIELNTRRLGKQNTIDAIMPIYKRYHQLGGQYITIGSDAHNAAAIGFGLDIATEFAAECSLTPVYFKNRKRYLIN